MLISYLNATPSANPVCTCGKLNGAYFFKVITYWSSTQRLGFDCRLSATVLCVTNYHCLCYRWNAKLDQVSDISPLNTIFIIDLIVPDQSRHRWKSQSQEVATPAALPPHVRTRNRDEAREQALHHHHG